MNWDAIGAVGEIVGAIAVVVTLAYLAVQVRMARITAAAETTYSTLEAYSRWRMAILQNSNIALAIGKANRGDTLDDEEHILLRNLMDDFFFVSVISTTSTDQWDSLQDKVVDLEYVKLIFAENPGLVRYWQRVRPVVALVSDEYAQTVDKIVQNKHDAAEI